MYNADLAQKAKNYAFLLLKFRLRSAYEIQQRLRQKKFSPQVISDTLAFLKERGFVDDALFARKWLAERLRKPLGLRRIRQELDLKGIGKEITEEAFREIKDDYAEEDIVARVARGRMEKLKGVEPLKAKSRLFSYLLRRGFSPEVVGDTLSDLCKQIS